jgi:isoleucyl-tRNA synthetase
MQFCSIDMGSFYLDIIKDRQYTAKADGNARRSCQTALYHIMEALVRWMAPIMSFTAQELWETMSGEREEFVFTQHWYEGFPEVDNSVQASKFDETFWQEVMGIKAQTNSILEKARNEKVIGPSLEACVTLYCDDKNLELLGRLEDELRFVLICSEAKIAPISEMPNAAQECTKDSLYVLLEKTQHSKCSRCWHHKSEVGTDPKHPELCNRCIENVDGNGEQRQYA